VNYGLKVLDDLINNKANEKVQVYLKRAKEILSSFQSATNINVVSLIANATKDLENLKLKLAKTSLSAEDLSTTNLENFIELSQYVNQNFTSNPQEFSFYLFFD